MTATLSESFGASGFTSQTVVIASIAGRITAEYAAPRRPTRRFRVGCRPTTASGISDKRRLTIEVSFCDLKLELRLSRTDQNGLGRAPTWPSRCRAAYVDNRELYTIEEARFVSGGISRAAIHHLPNSGETRAW
jgi:hypothetical protein